MVGTSAHLEHGMTTLLQPVDHGLVAPGSPATADAILNHTRVVTARRQGWRFVLWGLVALPVGAVSLVAMDALCALPSAVRAAADLAIMLAAIAMILAGLWMWMRPRQRNVLRLAELALHDHDRRLTVSMELSAMSQLAAAAYFAPTLDTGQASTHLDRGLAPVRWHAQMAAISASMLAATAMWLFLPGCYSAILPRLTNPWGDHPPWSRLHLSWQQLPAVVAYDETPTLNLMVSGGEPRDLMVHFQAESGTEATTVAPFLIARGVYAVTLAPVQQPLIVWASANGTRTTYQHLHLDPVPRLIDCHLTVTAPAYARLPDDNVPASASSPAQLQLLSGSSVKIEVKASRELCALWWGPLGQPGDDGNRHLLGSAGITVNDPAAGDYGLALEAPDGSRSKPVQVAHIERRVDQPPTVVIEQPESDGLAVADAEIPLHITASDDLGLVRLTHYRMVDNVQVDTQESPLGGTSDGYRGSIDLHGLHAGQVVRIGAVARDSCPGGGQLSPLVERVLTIISHADYQKQLAETLDEQALNDTYGSLLKELGELQADIDKQQPVDAATDTPAAKAVRESLNTRLQALQDQVDALHAQDPLLAAEPDLQQELMRQIQALKQQLQHPQAHPAGDATSSPSALTAREIQQLTNEARELALREDLSDLAQEQESLRQQLHDLQAHPKPGSDADRARFRQIAREQQAIDRDLRQWREDAKSLAAECDHPGGDSAELVKRVNSLTQAFDDSQAQHLVSAAARSAMVNQLPEAAHLSEDAAMAMSRFIMSPSELESASCIGQCPGWCQGSHCCSSRSQLASMARKHHGHGKGSGEGIGGMMNGLQSGQGGLTSSVPIYGPRPTSTAASARRDHSGLGKGPGADGTEENHPELESSAPYQRTLKHTTAGIGASFSTDEQHRIQLYYDGLDGDPLAPKAKEPSK
jgi:hypothetical protein